MATDKIKRSVSTPACSAPGEETGRPRVARSVSILDSFWNFLSLRPVPPAKQSIPEEETEFTDAVDTLSKQVDPWTQAFCNVAVFVLMTVTGGIFWAVYCVLEPFLHPLLWAVLVGNILHPFKTTWTYRINRWLSGLEKRSIPLTAGLFLFPFFFFHSLSRRLERSVLDHWKVMLGSLVGVAALWLSYSCSLPLHLYRGMEVVMRALQCVQSVQSFTKPIQLVTLPSGLILLFFLTRSQPELKYTVAIKALSILVWFLATLIVASYALGSAVALPVVLTMFVVGGIVSVAMSIKSLLFPEKVEGERERRGVMVGVMRERTDGVGGRGGESGGLDLEAGRRRETEETELAMEKVENGEGRREARGRLSPELSDDGGVEEPDTGIQQSDLGNLSGGSVGFMGPNDGKQSPHVTFGKETKYSPVRNFKWEAEKKGIKEEREEGDLLEVRTVSPEAEMNPQAKVAGQISHERAVAMEQQHAQHNYMFILLAIFFLIVVFWLYPFLLVLLVPFASWAVLRRGIRAWLQKGYPLSSQFTSLSHWLHSRHPFLFPSPLPTLFKVFLAVDRKMLQFVRGSLDSLMSALMITSLLVSGLALTVFLALQIQVELSHYITMMSAVWNRTVSSNPQLQQWMGEERNTFHDTFGSFASQGYMYGREWLAQQVQSIMEKSLYNDSAVQKQVLNLYDQLYQSYVLRNTSMLDPVLVHHESETGGDMLNELWIIAVDNLETVIAVLRSVWTILSNNLSLALSLLYTFLQLLLSGGTALINTLVFLTTLFYLLCYSGEVYLPVSAVTDLLPTLIHASTAQQYSASFSKAIRSVFHASMERSLFYGVYTWLVHTIFGLPVSILPAVLAAIAGTVPFIHPCWIAMPAVLELWLVEGHTLSAVAVLSLSFLPVMFVDSVIYGEIERGHPYLTGLAVAGGIYFAGLEGAIIGPVLLCCLIFVHELYCEFIMHASNNE